MRGGWTEYWRETRSKGRLDYVLRRGLSLGGLMFGLLVLLPRYFMMVDRTDNLLVTGFLFLGLGLLLAWVLWVANERSYLRQATRNEPKDPPDEPSQ